MAGTRFSVEHEAGSDWKVVDNEALRKPIATGLDQDEAESLADQRNREHVKEKNNFVEIP